MPASDEGRGATFGLDRYELGIAYDEMLASNRHPRGEYVPFLERLKSLGPEEMARRQGAADAALIDQGITYTLDASADGAERVLPYDIVPRVISAAQWQRVHDGLTQRVMALNLFLKDVYGDGRIFHDRVVPRELVYTCANFRREMRGVRIPSDVYVAVAGCDLIRQPNGEFAVLEDNVRVPSGVSYMLANRQLSKSLFPTLFRDYRVSPIEGYARELLQTLRELTPTPHSRPTVVVLTPGSFNSAYYEHALLARTMGVQLVEGRDLIVHDNQVFMRTTGGLRRVDVIYRRLDEDFLDPLALRPDSMIGVPGLFNAYRAGEVNIVNAIGTGLADDKAVYAYVPAIIRYYLGEDAILPNVETYLASDPKHLDYIVENLRELVVKAVGGAGGHDMMIGPRASSEELDRFLGRILSNPRNYIAQPTISFSRAPCLVGGAMVPRHVDLRPFVLHGRQTRITPGGLTRVAMREGSLVVNSSQGGGTKDTWVLEG